MKKLLILCLLTIGFAFTQSLSAEEWEYKSRESLDMMDGRLYVRADCTIFDGDDCTTKGAS